MLIYSDKLFKSPIGIIKAFSERELFECFQKLDELRKSYYLVGYIRYEAKEVFHGRKIKSELPLLYFEVFDKYEKFTPDKNSVSELNASAGITFEEYKNALTEIKNEIAEGNTYEVNYTYDWLVQSDSEPFCLYQSLLHKQKTPYNAFFNNEYETVLSYSPELFFELEGASYFDETNERYNCARRNLRKRQRKYRVFKNRYKKSCRECYDCGFVAK